MNEEEKRLELHWNYLMASSAYKEFLKRNWSQEEIDFHIYSEDMNSFQAKYKVNLSVMYHFVWKSFGDIHKTTFKEWFQSNIKTNKQKLITELSSDDKFLYDTVRIILGNLDTKADPNFRNLINVLREELINNDRYIYLKIDKNSTAQKLKEELTNVKNFQFPTEGRAPKFHLKELKRYLDVYRSRENNCIGKRKKWKDVFDEIYPPKRRSKKMLFESKRFDLMNDYRKAEKIIENINWGGEFPGEYQKVRK